MGGSSQQSSQQMNPTYAAAATYNALASTAMSQDLWAMTKPYYQQQMDFSASTLNPYYTDLYNNARSLINEQTALSRAQLNESLADIDRNSPVKDALAQEQLKELQESSPVRTEFYRQALKGVDPDYEQVMGQATGAVEQQYAGSEAAIGRQLARTGLGANSGAYAAALSNANFNKAKDKAFARSSAYMTEKDNVETQNWNRLAQATSLAGRASGLAGSDTSQASSSSRNLTASSATNPFTSSEASSGVSRALSGMSDAAGIFTDLGNGNSTKTTSGGDSGWGSVVGTGVGLLGSAALKKWG